MGNGEHDGLRACVWCVVVSFPSRGWKHVILATGNILPCYSRRAQDIVETVVCDTYLVHVTFMFMSEYST